MKNNLSKLLFYIFKSYNIPVTYRTIEQKLKTHPEYPSMQSIPEQYELLEMNKISGFVDRARGLGRPTKKERRDLEQFMGFDEIEDMLDDSSSQ